MSQGLLNSVRERDRLKKISTCNPESELALNKYRDYRTKLTKLISKTKTHYYKTLLDKHTNDPKKMWNVIHSITNGKDSVTQVKGIKDERDVVVSDPESMANILNKYFSSVGKNLAKKIIKPKKNREIDDVCENSMYLAPVTERELLKELSGLKSNTACGEDEVSAEMIKNHKEKLTKPLIHLINTIFQTGTFPLIFRSAVVIPVFKAGDRLNVSNYRPIALTSVLARLVERCIKERLWRYLEKYNLISKNQFGFRKGYGTDDAIDKVSNHIVSSLNEGSKPLAIFLDLSKAFDTVDHRILISKLERIGIRGIVLNLFQSYLRDRVQKVKIGDNLSKEELVEFGVPQGTVLGPLLFLIYVNSLTKILDNRAKILCYADDTAVLIKADTWQESLEIAEKSMTIIKHWMDSNLLTLNVQKSFYIPFSISNVNIPTRSIEFHNHSCTDILNCKCNNSIAQKDKIKYLGVYFDQHMKWHVHVDYIVNALLRIVYKFYESRQIVSQKTIRQIYQALVQPILNYGIASWGAACNNVLASLFVSQKYILKVMLFKKRLYSSERLFKDVGLLNIRQLYIEAIIKKYYKNKIILPYVNHKKETRSITNNAIALPQTNFAATQRHYTYTLPKIINLLPINYRCVSYNKIKKELKDWIIQNYTVIVSNIHWFRA